MNSAATDERRVNICISMKDKFEILTGIEEPHREPTVESAEAYARFILKCATRQLSERHEVAKQFGWPIEEVEDKIFYSDYQKERALILFPSLAKEIKASPTMLIVPEVDRAEANFTKLTGIALNEQSISLNELGNLLTLLTSTESKVDLSLTDSREQKEDGEKRS